MTSDKKIHTLLLAGGYKGHLNSKNIQYGGITVQPSSNSPRAKQKKKKNRTNCQWKLLLVRFSTLCAFQTKTTTTSSIAEDIAAYTRPGETPIWFSHFPPLSLEQQGEISSLLLENVCTSITSLLSAHFPAPTIQTHLRNSLFFLKSKGNLSYFNS